ncbi:MAG: hypothetical protein ACLFVT_03845 [Syntrophobacteria bacterium]
MKAGIIFTGSGPILILTTFESFENDNLVQKLNTKGIKKFIAYEVPVDLVKKRYGGHFDVIMQDLTQTDDLRVLDYNGHRVPSNFTFSQMGAGIQHEAA